MGWGGRRDEIVGFRSLKEALETCCSVPELKHRAKLFKGKAPTRKGELITFLVSQMEGAGLTKLWEQLDDLSKKAVAEAIYEGTGLLDTELFRAKYGVEPPKWLSPVGPYELTIKAAPQPISMLIFRNGWVPDDLQERLEEFVPEPEDPVLATVSELPDHPPGFPEAFPRDAGEIKLHREDTALAALHDVRAVLALVDERKVKVGSKTGHVSLPGARAILSVLRQGDFLMKDAAKLNESKHAMRAFAWPLLLQAGKLAEVAGSRLRLTRAGKKALSEPPHEVIRGLWNRWLDSTLLDELRRISEVKGQTKRGVLTDVAERRETIGLGLLSCRDGQWVEVNEFMRYLASCGASFEVARNRWSLYLGDAQYGSLGYEGYSDWLAKWYLLVFLWEYAATLGLVDVAFTKPAYGHADYRRNWGGDFLDHLSQYDGLYYFRLNSLGAWVLELASEFVAPEPEARLIFRVLPNLEVTATGEALQPADRLFLERFAERKNERTWSLELAGLLQAVEAGVQLSQIRTFLEAGCGGAGIPETVRRLFEDAEGRVGRIEDRGAARLYACEDERLARLVISDSRLGKLCHLADGCLLVVASGSDRAFRQALRQLGYVAPSVTAE